MASIVNPYFPKNTSTEQHLFESMYTESIQCVGRTFIYLPRHMQVKDIVIGEDALSSFTTSIDIEGYMETTTGFQGDKEIFTKFGLEIHDQTYITISQVRWLKEVAPKLDRTAVTSSRPAEGDLIYDPLTKRLLEIKFVDNDPEFFAIGRNYTYRMSCESFQYNNEDLQTGIAEIDAFETDYSNDTLSYQLLDEDGNILIQENGDFILQNIEVLEPENFQLLCEDLSALTTEADFYLLEEYVSSPDIAYGTNFDKLNDNIGFNIKNPFW